ncbi:hypothetical protein PIB30_061830 [Stylosanthes scabra]|uniref:Uncharacterized protein n=1 Tax=Stylosanthes scabra TaxID=79078 RepID=A0ABU6QKT1_9FABA|nr:hypothetical protein [Stylosanthes scabra]
MSQVASYRTGRDQRLDPSSSAFVALPLPFQGMGYTVSDFATSPAQYGTQYGTPPAYYDFLSGPNPTPQQDESAAREPSPPPPPQRPTRTIRPPPCSTGGHLHHGSGHIDECHPPTRMACSARWHGCTAGNSKIPSQIGKTAGRAKHRCTMAPPEYLRRSRSRNAAAPPTASAACRRTPPSPHTTGQSPSASQSKPFCMRAGSGSSVEGSFAEQEFQLTD